MSPSPRHGPTVGLIFAKEMRETLRDRRTLIVMVLLPIVLYPVVFLVFGQGLISFESTLAEKPSRVGFSGPVWPELQAMVRAEPKLSWQGQRDRGALGRGEVDLVIELPAGLREALRGEGSAAITLVYDQTEDRSTRALSRVKPALATVDRVLRDTRLVLRGLPLDFHTPLRLKQQNIASAEAVGAHLLARVLPLLAVLMVLLGAFYPAIDLTAGEKERGTLETLLATPTPRTTIIAGKFLVVAVVATATGLLNLASIGLTVQLALSGAPALAEVTPPRIPWTSVALAVIAVVPAALFFSALMVAVAALARSFKEAQNLLTPVYMACMMPAFAAMVPGVELTPLSALVPAMNVSLLTRELIAGRLEPLPLGVCLAATALYTAAALKLAAGIYRSERMLFAPEAIWRRLGDGGAGLRGAPEPREAAALLLVVMGLIVLVGHRLQAVNVVAGLLVTEWLLVAGPVLLTLRLGHIAPRPTLSLRPALPRVYLGAALAGLSGWLVVGVLVETLQQRVLPIPPEVVEAMQKALFSGERSLALDLFALAISPAICEELLFRGVLLRASLRRLTPGAAVLLNGVLFGIFHLSIYRFFPTMLLGMVLCLIVLRGGSLYPAMLFHLLNNGCAVVAGRLLSTEQEQSTLLAAPFVAGGLTVFVLGLILALGVSRPPAQTEGPPPRDAFS